MSNPYTGQSFFNFFVVLASRLWGFLTGHVTDLAADEVQILVLAGIAMSAAMVGTFLVLRKMAMLANSLSHTILLGIVLAYLATRDGLLDEHVGHLNMKALLVASLIMGVLTTFLTQFLTRTARLQEDASLGLVFTTLFALGIVAVTLLTRSAHIGLEAVMGNADALRPEDCRFVFLILALNLVLILFFFKEYQLTTFDPALAQALGFSTAFFSYLLMAQVAMTAIGAFRAVGVLMFLAFITGPVLTARLLTHRLKAMLAISVGLGSLASLLGVALARHLLSAHDMALSTGGIVVCVITAIYLSVIFIRIAAARLDRAGQNALKSAS